MFASKTTNLAHNLERCFRIHPDLNDTGGLLRYSFEKVKPLPMEMIALDAKEEQKLSRTTNADTKKWTKAKIAPVFSVGTDDKEFKAVIKRIKTKYGFDVEEERRERRDGDDYEKQDRQPKRIYCPLKARNRFSISVIEIIKNKNFESLRVRLVRV